MTTQERVKKFFTQYPDAPGLLQVGETLYLITDKARADQQSRKTGQPVSEVANPSFSKPAKKVKDATE